jgi:SPP1 family predicted phage head-tail adaptor
MPDVRAGQLRNRIQIFQMQDQTLSTGQVKAIPEPLFSRWASIETTAGKESFEGQQVRSENSILVRIPFTEGVKSDMLLKYKNRTFNIVAVNDLDERHRTMELTCVERGIAASDPQQPTEAGGGE